MSSFSDESGDGFSAAEIFRNPESVQAYTYDDLIIMPGNFPASSFEIFLDYLSLQIFPFP